MGKQRWLRSALFAAMLTFILMSMNACNTTKGAGKDIEKTGEKLQDAAD